MCWKLASQKGFEVSSYHRALAPSGAVKFPWKSSWKPKVPSRVSFFIWTASVGRILTAKNLRKRNIILVSWCCMCKQDGETVTHLLLHCFLLEKYGIWFLGMWSSLGDAYGCRRFTSL